MGAERPFFELNERPDSAPKFSELRVILRYLGLHSNICRVFAFNENIQSSQLRNSKNSLSAHSLSKAETGAQGGSGSFTDGKYH